MMGLGYIGLPTAAVIANKGTKVLGVDVNSSVVNATYLLRKVCENSYSRI